MNNLKIGDRVRVVFVPGLFKSRDDEIKIGTKGIVKHLRKTDVGVEFDEYINGHDGWWGGKYGYCWYVPYERLEKIEEPDIAEETKEGVNEEMKPDKEMINHPVHYTHGKIECIDAIESATCDLTGVEAVCTGNIIKYVWRWKFKNGVEDLEKASWYLNKLIKEVKGDKNAYAEDGQIDEVEK